MAFMGNTGPYNVGNSRSPLLRPNAIFNSIYNFIINQTVYEPDLTQVYDFVSRARKEVGMYGDTILMYETPEHWSEEWTGNNQTEANNLLTLVRPRQPKVQQVTISNYRKIRISIDEYQTKNAWMTQGSFAQFNNIITGLITKSKALFENRMLCSFIGTTESKATKGIINVDLTTAKSSASTEEEARKLEVLEMGNAMANLLVELKDTTPYFNDYHFLRSVNPNDLYFIFNSNYYNKFRKLDMPLLFKDYEVDKMNSDVLPETYFGVTITSDNVATYSDATPTTGKPINSSTGAYTPGSNNANGCIRSLIETLYEVSSESTDPRKFYDENTSKYYVHLYPGDELVAGTTIGASKDFAYGDVYIQTDDVICKIVDKNGLVYLNAFSTTNSFWNPSSLTTTYFAIFGYADPVYEFGKPFLTVKAV